jgi:hypothetical protein
MINNNLEQEIKDKLQYRVKLENYKDPDGLTVGKLNFSLWLLVYKKILKIILIGFLSLIIALTGFNFINNFLPYILSGYQIDAALLNAQLFNTFPNQELLQGMAAKDLDVSPAVIFANGAGRFDVIDKIRNSNSDYWAEFDYYVISGEKKFGPNHNFVLPGEEKFLFMLGISSEKRIARADILFENFVWQRIDGHIIPDWDIFKNERINFFSGNKKFIPSFSSNLSEKLKLSVVEFDVSNLTPYNYHQVNFNIFIHNRGELISVGRFSPDNFLANETRYADITWPEQITAADIIEIVPDVNIMDKTNYFVD